MLQHQSTSFARVVQSIWPKIKNESGIIDLVNVDYANNMRLGSLLTDRFGLTVERVTDEMLRPFNLKRVKSYNSR